MGFDEKMLERKAMKRPKKKAEREKSLADWKGLLTKTELHRQQASKRVDSGIPPVPLAQFQEAQIALNKESVSQRMPNGSSRSVVKRDGLTLPVTGEMAMRKAVRDAGMENAPEHAVSKDVELER